MTEIKNESCVGQIRIADEVIAVIAKTAAMEIEGVAFMTASRDISDIWGRKNQLKGIKVTVSGADVQVEINLVIKMGYKVKAVTRGVQERVKTAVENMTGLSVKDVSINVIGVHMGKEKQLRAEENKGK